MLRMTRDGEIYERWDIDDAPGEYPSLKCISQVSGSLVLGFVDSDTELATIGFQRNGNNGLQYNELGVSGSSMSATDEGIFVSGYKRMDGKKHPWYALIGRDGEPIFEYNGKAVFHWSAGYCSTDVGHLLKLYTQKEVNGESIVELLMLDHAGNELWRKSYSSDILPMGISSHAGNIYVSGVLFEENGMQRSMVMCTDLDGHEKWRQVFAFPERLGNYNLSVDDACMTTITENWIMYICTLSSDGETRKLYEVDLHDGLNTRGIYNTERGTYIVIGTTGDHLFMYEGAY